MNKKFEEIANKYRLGFVECEAYMIPINEANHYIDSFINHHKKNGAKIEEDWLCNCIWIEYN